MSIPIRLLLVEDSENDAALLVRQLRQAGYEPAFERIETADQMAAALDRQAWDLVISDYCLPEFNGLAALKVLQDRELNLPFIIVSGTIGEEVAIEAIHAGAHDYLLKDRLVRLGPAVARALNDMRLREERRSAVETLRQSEGRYRTLFEESPFPIWEEDFSAVKIRLDQLRAEGVQDFRRYFEQHGDEVRHCAGLVKVLDISRASVDFFKVRNKTEVCMNLPQCFEADSYAVFCEELTALAEGKTRFDSEIPIRLPSGERLMLELHLVVAFGQEQTLKRVLVSFFDITERKRSEEQIRSQARLLDLARDAIIVGDLEDQILYVNQGASDLYGWLAEEILGRKVSEVFYLDRSAFKAAKQQLLESGEWRGELRQITRNHRELIVNSRWTLVRDDQGQPQSVLIINTDITEQKKLAAQFLRAQRLESVGRLASGIAHDLNNILTPILMSVPLLRKKSPNEDIRTILDAIEASAQRGANIVKQMLTFSRGVEGQKIPLHLGTLIQEMAKIIQETFPKSITLKTFCSQDLWTLNGDPTQLYQVLMNLCINARDAMPQGGVLTLGAENVRVEAPLFGMVDKLEPGTYVLLTLSDTGTGIPPEILDQIFEPFFTTKKMDQGTGLGLSTVLGIVRNHGGLIRVASQIGAGTQFSIYLPATVSATLPPSGPRPQLVPNGSGELILVVDDEEQVRKATQLILKTHGYRTLLASDGAEAITLYGAHQSDIQLVLTDLMMPVMDGAATIQALRRMNPQVKIIATSGGGFPPSTPEAKMPDVNAFLAKPFSTARLREVLHDVLRGTSDAAFSRPATGTK